jgi:hypothetical protein
MGWEWEEKVFLLQAKEFKAFHLTGNTG